MRITKKSIISFFLSILFVLPSLFSVLFINPALADPTLVEGQVGMSEVRSVFGGSRAEQDVRFLITRIISITLSFLGVIFFALAIFAGFQYMTAGGNQEKTSKALKLLKNAIIGLLIILAAWVITRFSIVMLNRAVRNADISDYPQIGM